MSVFSCSFLQVYLHIQHNDIIFALNRLIDDPKWRGTNGALIERTHAKYLPERFKFVLYLKVIAKYIQYLAMSGIGKTRNCV